MTSAQENVILFNADSRLWVRYHNGSNLEYGELNGFFRMRADFFEPYGVESFAYARPKLTVKNVQGLAVGDELNKDDGGFLSYVPTNNFHTQVSDGYQYDGDDGGNPFTQTKQYPYTNVIEASRTVNCEYRMWVIPKMKGGRWYVDGRETGGLGVDNMDNGRGRYPNMPKMTITASNGIYAGAHELDGTSVSFNQAEDIIYVVGHVNSKLETGFTAAHNLNFDGTTPLRLFRYPGGHQLSSNTATDPGPNYSDMLLAESNYTLTLNNVLVDGLYGHSGFDNEYYAIPTTFNASSVTEPLVVTRANATLTVNGGTRLMRGYNNTDGQVWFTNPDYVPVANVHHGGALFVDAGATVNVAGLVTIIDNLQNNDGTPIESNVYLPSFTKYLNITGPLASGTEIGVTNPIRNTAARYTSNTFSPVAVASNATDAQNAWSHNTFYDDLDWFFYREGAERLAHVLFATQQRPSGLRLWNP